jgi:hypothetical protein
LEDIQDTLHGYGQLFSRLNLEQGDLIAFQLVSTTVLSLLAEESFNIFHPGAKRCRKLGGIAAGVFRVFFESRGLADQAVKARDGRQRHRAARLF